MPDAWRAYLEMALGLTEAPRKRAQKVAGELVSRGGATAAQLQGLVEDLLQTSVANREALTNIVRYEVDRALGVVGLATADEVSELTSKVRDLEKQLGEAQARAATAGAGPVPARTPVPSKVAKKAVAKKAVAKKAAEAVAIPSQPVPARPDPQKAAPASKAVAKKAVAKKAVAKKAAPAGPSVPAGTAESPVAGVRVAAAATELPAASESASSASAPADDVLTESIGEDLSAAEREALRAVASETTAAGQPAPAKKAAPARKTAAKKAAPQKTAAKKAAPQKTAAKKAPAKKAATPTTTPEA
jgi:polyhydroxyalkanoate synthesis regulator phasin